MGLTQSPKNWNNLTEELNNLGVPDPKKTKLGLTHSGSPWV